MPTVPDFDRDFDKIVWLRRHFKSESHYSSVLSNWNVVIRRTDKAVAYAGYFSALILTTLSTLQSLLTTSDDASSRTAIDILSYIQCAVGIFMGLIGVICKIIKENNLTARKRALTVFTPDFFTRSISVSPSSSFYFDEEQASEIAGALAEYLASDIDDGTVDLVSSLNTAVEEKSGEIDGCAEAVRKSLSRLKKKHFTLDFKKQEARIAVLNQYKTTIFDVIVQDVADAAVGASDAKDAASKAESAARQALLKFDRGKDEFKYAVAKKFIKILNALAAKEVARSTTATSDDVLGSFSAKTGTDPGAAADKYKTLSDVLDETANQFRGSGFGLIQLAEYLAEVASNVNYQFRITISAVLAPMELITNAVDAAGESCGAGRMDDKADFPDVCDRIRQMQAKSFIAGVLREKTSPETHSLSSLIWADKDAKIPGEIFKAAGCPKPEEKVLLDDDCLRCCGGFTVHPCV